MKKHKKKTWKTSAIKGALIGLLCGVVFFVFDLITLTFWKESVEKSIVGDSFKLLSYVPLEVFSYFVDIGILNKHDAITAMAFIGIWFCLIFSTMGCAIGLLSCLCTKGNMNSDD